MAHLHSNVTVSGSEKTTVVKMLVDTGATYSVIPKAIARSVGITPQRCLKVRLSLPDGRRRNLEASAALFRIGHREAPGTILVGDVVEPVLGVSTLDALGLAVDSGGRKLIATRPYTVRLTGYR